MNTIHQGIAALLLAGCGALGAPRALGAEIGSPLPALAVADSNGRTLTLDAGIRRIYANADRKGDKMIKAAMVGRDQATLDAQRAIVVADISAAPGFVRRIIRKDLQQRSYITWMDETGQTRGVLPYREDHITVLDLDDGRLTAIGYIADVETLRQALAAPGPATAAGTASPPDAD